MDRLSKHGEDEFDKEQTSDQSSHGSLITVLHALPDSFQKHDRVERESTPALKLTLGTLEANTSALSLVQIDRDPTRELQIPKKTFLLLFHGFHLEPNTLYMLHRELYGFATALCLGCPSYEHHTAKSRTLCS
jgi:hypothetical protein